MAVKTVTCWRLKNYIFSYEVTRKFSKNGIKATEHLMYSMEERMHILCGVVYLSFCRSEGKKSHTADKPIPPTIQKANGHNTVQTTSVLLVKDILKNPAAGDRTLLRRLITSHASRKPIKKSNLQNGLSHTSYLSINILKAFSN